MPLKTLVKAGNITNLSDARYCAGMGVSMLGFRTIEGEENFIAPKVFQDIRGWIAGPKVVAEIYGIRDRGMLDQVLENYRPDVLELGLNDLAKIGGSSPLPVIISVTTDQITSVPTNSLDVAYLLVKGFQSGNKVDTSIPVLIDLQDADMLAAVLEQLPSAGIAVSGTAEIKPGLKDYELLANVLEQLDSDD